MLEPGDVPILLCLELDPKRAKITRPIFGLYSSPIEYSTVGHIMLDLTSLAYLPKSRERSARPTKHETVALSQRESAYPARVQKLDDDEDLHLKHYHMSSGQFKKRATHLDIPGKVYDLYPHVVKTCPFGNLTKPTPDR